MHSEYYHTLDTESAARYRQKIDSIGVDPYLIDIGQCNKDIKQFPNIIYPDIVNYLLYTKSAYSYEDFKAYKGLEAYKQAVGGWVKKVAVKNYKDKVLVLGNVMHSQRLSGHLLKPWIITQCDGTILFAHCNCMAGLGETCTHVCAVLFFIDMCHRNLHETSPTDVKALWMVPAKNVAEPKKVADIDFAVPSTSKSTREQPLFVREKTFISANVPPLTKQDVSAVLSVLKETTKGCVLHSVVSPFSDEIKNIQKEESKYMLSSLYHLEYEQESLKNLQEIGIQLDLSIPIEICKEIEKATNKQASSRAWFHYRAGRVTASKFKAVCRTKLTKPSNSLIKSICYPAAKKIKTKPTIYGCQHEKEALKVYSAQMQTLHKDFGSEPVGFCINPEYPYFGASPDGLVSCECCGLGCVEIKCPYCAKDLDIEDMQVLKKVGLEDIEGEKHLRSDHAYYQVQMQLAITKLAYCDFVVWNKNKFILERITFNETFWENESKIAKTFFYNVLLPELLGKYFTRESDIENRYMVD